jgi:hypothetical protein
MKKILLIILSVIVAFIIIESTMIAFPPPKSVPMLAALEDPFQSVNFSKIPDIQYYMARDGSQLAYREYLKQPSNQIVVLVHGSSGSSGGMHPLAEYLQKQGKQSIRWIYAVMVIRAAKEI